VYLAWCGDAARCRRASYNIPYFPFVYNISGYWPYFEKYGNTYSHDHCARANIFRRDAPQVQDLPDMQDIMRSVDASSPLPVLCWGSVR
jgi:hypothetical protein